MLFNRNRLVAIPVLQDDYGRPLQFLPYEVRHAPAGGVNVAGEHFEGGEFIPAGTMAKATAREKAAVEGRGKKHSKGSVHETEYPQDDNGQPLPEKKKDEHPQDDDGKSLSEEKWDGEIDDDDVEVSTGANAESQISSFTRYGDEGMSEEIEIYLQEGKFTKPNGEKIAVWRWEERISGESRTFGLLSYGDWTTDDDQAEKDGKKYAEDATVPPPEPTDSDIPSGIGKTGYKAWNESNTIATYTNEDGHEQEVRLQEAEFEYYGESYTAYRWLSYDGDVRGDWTLDKHAAVEEGNNYAVENHQEKTHPETWEEDPDVTRRPNVHLPHESRPDLSDSQKNYLWRYSWGYDGEMNRELRTSGTPPGEYGGSGDDGKPDIDGEEMFAELQEAFNAVEPWHPPKTVWRGLKNLPDNLIAAIEKASQSVINTEKTITLPGFLSTSTSGIVAKGFGGKVLYKISANRGLDMMPYTHFPHEYELLLNHNTQFRVLNVERASGRLLIELEQV